MLSPCVHSEIYIFFFEPMKYSCRKSTVIFFNFPLIPTSSADPENFPGGGGSDGYLSLLRHIFGNFIM